VGKRALEAQDVDVEALGPLEIARLEARWRRPRSMFALPPLTDALEDELLRALALATSVV